MSNANTNENICNKCGQPSEFYRRGNGALVRPCKSCMSKAASEWARSHPERAKQSSAVFRTRHREAIRARDRAKIARNPEANRRRVRAWKAQNPARHSAQNRRWMANNSARMAVALPAYNAVRRAIRAGLLIRPEHCASCGQGSLHIEASHDDYSKPLEVVWLCRSCHRRKDALSPKTKAGHIT